MKKSNLLFLVIFALFPILATASEQLVVYSGRSDKFIKPVVKEFTKATGIKVILHSAKSTALLNKLKLEGDRTDADLFISNDAGNLQKGSELGLFTSLPTNLVKKIPANYRASDNSWLGLSARARVLVINKNSKIAGDIKSVFDLAKPELKDKIAITHSANGSFIAGATVYMLTDGEQTTLDWLKGLSENAGRNVYNKHSKVVKAVAKGKADVGLVNHYYIYRHLAKKPNAPIDILIPDQGKNGRGVAWNVAGIAITKYTKKQKAALKFVEFLASKDGQKMFAEVNKEYPTRTDVATAKEIPALASIKVANVPMEQLGAKRNATLDLIEKAGMQ